MKINELLQKIANKMIANHMFHQSTEISNALSSSNMKYKYKMFYKYEYVLYI